MRTGRGRSAPLRGRAAAPACLAFALVAACGGETAGGGAAAATPEAAGAGGRAIEVVDVDGVRQWLERHRGRPILLNAWATWCVPCVAELPDLLTATREFRAQGGIVVGLALERVVDDVTVAQAVAKVERAAERLQLDFPLLVCTADEIAALRPVLGPDFGVLPHTWVHDAAGTVVAHHEGSASAEEFAALAAKGRAR